MSESRVSSCEKPAPRWGCGRPLSFILAIVVVLSIASTGSGWSQEERLAGRLVREGEIDSALVIVDTALTRDSLRIGLWYLRDEILRCGGDNVNRIVSLREALRYWPGEDDLRIRLAEALVDSGTVDEATANLWRAIPDTGEWTARAHYVAGRIHEAHGQPDSALVAYRRAWSLATARRLF